LRNQVDIARLRFGAAEIDLKLEQHEHDVGVDVTRKHGDGKVFLKIPVSRRRG
jgi:hypothetical protein